MKAKIEIFANADAIGHKTQHPTPLGLAAYRQFLYGIFSFRNEVHAQTPTESVIAIKKHFTIEDFPPVQSKLPAATSHVYLLLTISAYP